MWYDGVASRLKFGKGTRISITPGKSTQVHCFLMLTRGSVGPRVRIPKWEHFRVPST